MRLRLELAHRRGEFVSGQHGDRLGAARGIDDREPTPFGLRDDQLHVSILAVRADAVDSVGEGTSVGGTVKMTAWNMREVDVGRGELRLRSRRRVAEQPVSWPSAVCARYAC